MSDTERLDWLIKQNGIDWRWLDPSNRYSRDVERERLDKLIRSQNGTGKVRNG